MTADEARAMTQKTISIQEQAQNSLMNQIINKIKELISAEARFGRYKVSCNYSLVALTKIDQNKLLNYFEKQGYQYNSFYDRSGTRIHITISWENK